MELVVKLPKGKLPFIGIKFAEMHEANELNKDLMNNYSTCIFKVILEPHKNEMNLRLICEEKLLVRFYNGLKYDPEKLKAWIYLTKTAKSFNFSHIYQLGDKEKVAMAIMSRKLFVLKLEGYEILHQ
jgi:hypothetical protein